MQALPQAAAPPPHTPPSHPSLHPMHIQLLRLVSDWPAFQAWRAAPASAGAAPPPSLLLRTWGWGLQVVSLLCHFQISSPTL